MLQVIKFLGEKMNDGKCFFFLLKFCFKFYVNVSSLMKREII